MREHILFAKVATRGTACVPAGGINEVAAESVQALAMASAWFKAGDVVSALDLSPPDRRGKTGVFFRQTFTGDDQEITRRAAQQ